jgi:chromosome segregation ATPase
VGIRKLKQVEVKVLELEETMENLARQLKEANTNFFLLLDENRKGEKVLEEHEKQIKEL